MGVIEDYGGASGRKPPFGESFSVGRLIGQESFEVIWIDPVLKIPIRSVIFFPTRFSPEFGAKP